MFCNSCGVPVAAAAASCPNCGDRISPAIPIAGHAIRSQIPYGWKFFAALQIGAGLLLLTWLVLFQHQLDSSIRYLMLIGGGIALPLGYGLWNQARWALYMLTTVFFLEACIWVAGFRHSTFRPTLDFYLHGVMVYYYWQYRANFVKRRMEFGG